ncbi:MAG: hypothetical protein U0941_15980 [Planctomycetaceae bacterium]
MKTFEDRLAVLEATNTRLRMGFYSLIGLIAMCFTLGAAPKGAAKADGDVADEIKAKRLVIVDDDGGERIVLEVAKKRLNNEIKTDKRTEVFATLRLADSEGVERASLDASDGGLSRLKLFSGEGKRRIEAVTAGDGYADVLLYDKNGKEVEKQLR